MSKYTFMKCFNIKVLSIDTSNGKKIKQIIKNIPERYIKLSSYFRSQIDNNIITLFVNITNEDLFNFESIKTLFEYIAHLDLSSEGKFIKLTAEQYFKLYAYKTISDIEKEFTFKDEHKFKSVNLAHFLDIPIIVESLSNLIANDIKGKSPEEIREMLGLDDDLTPEQKAEIEREIEAINLIQQSE